MNLILTVSYVKTVLEVARAGFETQGGIRQGGPGRGKARAEGYGTEMKVRSRTRCSLCDNSGTAFEWHPGYMREGVPRCAPFSNPVRKVPMQDRHPQTLNPVYLVVYFGTL